MMEVKLVDFYSKSRETACSWELRHFEPVLLRSVRVEIFRLETSQVSVKEYLYKYKANQKQYLIACITMKSIVNLELIK